MLFNLTAEREHGGGREDLADAVHLQGRDLHVAVGAYPICDGLCVLSRHQGVGIYTGAKVLKEISINKVDK